MIGPTAPAADGRTQCDSMVCSTRVPAWWCPSRCEGTHQLRPSGSGHRLAPNSRMAFTPDYGLRRKRDGLDSSVEIHIKAFPMDHVSVLSRGLYSTFADIHYAGEFHAISLYFGQDHLEAILSRGPLRLRLFVKFELDQDPATPRTIDFPENVYCDVCARLGEEEQGKYESFIPFTVQSISDSLGSVS